MTFLYFCEAYFQNKLLSMYIIPPSCHAVGGDILDQILNWNWTVYGKYLMISHQISALILVLHSLLCLPGCDVIYSQLPVTPPPPCLISAEIRVILSLFLKPCLKGDDKSFFKMAAKKSLFFVIQFQKVHFKLYYGIKCTCCAFTDILQYLSKDRAQIWEKWYLILSGNRTPLRTQEKMGNLT